VCEQKLSTTGTGRTPLVSAYRTTQHGEKTVKVNTDAVDPTDNMTSR
jgi:hypothetical protein